MPELDRAWSIQLKKAIGARYKGSRNNGEKSSGRDQDMTFLAASPLCEHADRVSLR